MRTIITEKIDGYQIIIGFGIPAIDAIESEKQGKIVYFKLPCTTIITEELIDEIVYADLLLKYENLTETQRLQRSGEIIIDKRNTEYWIMNSNSVWEKILIEHIGIDVDSAGILPENLSDTQKNEIYQQEEKTRIATLSVSAKETEKTGMIESMVAQAVSMRSKLEIQGSSSADALSASQEWYNRQLEIINQKYS